MKRVVASARVAGALYLVIAAAAIIAHFVVPGSVIVDGDAAATTANIARSPGILDYAVGGELVVLISEVILSLLLFYLLRPVNELLALISAAARLVMTTIHGFNLVFYFLVVRVAGGAGFVESFTGTQRALIAELFLDAHAYAFTIGVAFLALHAVLLGYLIYRSGYFPRLIGVLFLIASAGYLVDAVLLLFAPWYETTPAPIAIPIAVAEIAFPIWLLVRGVRLDRWNERAGVAG
jgi:hypothetical protein